MRRSVSTTCRCRPNCASGCRPTPTRTTSPSRRSASGQRPFCRRTSGNEAVMSEDDGFLSRWVRRKAQAKAGVVTEGEPAPVVAPTPLPTAAEASVEIPAEQQSPPLTMDDVAALTRESDFSRFIAPEVDESIQRAAMKKLFADPHF